MDYEQKPDTKRIIIGDGTNCERPSKAMSLLNEASKVISKIYDEKLPTADSLQPFLVRDIIIDVYNGYVTIYLEDEGSDIKDNQR